ncbi:MAG: response regulator [Hyphomonas sp.]|uniref:ATP-binding response regulator n=1 Tax=Hyphomonas sp. TaxID=87 RepID=UPI0017A7172C|nr:ATP-binding protein [Hyphomonas sp.]MBU3922578.1 response regulator [Alphaproteobacteria bacterium]MBA3068276.1 response regulator [Hyphomonas sp.]MBU4060858.1 response regulator [Alphaproteobacteria bacterium]MBU4164842.1 response regulator [Alphaproteobacteria bacterium]MBU4567417.1 response regulator [Alphaproteobacteria bacterium]
MPVRLKDIALPVAPVTPATTAAAAFSLFLSDAALFAVPVRLGEGETASYGIVTRVRLTEALAGPNGRDVYAARSVSHLVGSQPVVAAADTLAAVIAKSAAEKSTSALTDGVLVMDAGTYIGMVSPTALLKAVAEENAARARSQQSAQKKLEDLQRQLARLSESRARTLAFIGHEIRTPLTGILGVADLLESQLSPGEPKRLARTISQSGQHLERLLTDLLDLSRIDAGKLPVLNQPIELRQFALETRDLWLPQFDEKRVSLRIGVATHAVSRIESDAARLRQILFNLVSNAVKFTDRGQVTVTLATSPAPEGLMLTMRVADTGRGISDEDKKRLFQIFEQSEHADAYSGSGLGLSIARSLARRLGGDIILADNPGGGCVFTVALPVQKAGPRLAVENKTDGHKGRFDLGEVLLAEDHEASAMVIRESLIAAGWKVETVPDAAAAIRRVGQRRYQVILTDVHMPNGGGEAVLKAARYGQGLNALTPVVAVTADTSPERRAACDRAGFSGLIEKPVRPRPLVAALADILISSAQLQRAAGQ